jgi:hypothetical protein
MGRDSGEHLELPAPPKEQVALRRHLERVLDEWGFSYTHEDVCRKTMGGVQCGWGTNVHVPSRRTKIHVWFDALDSDIAIYGGRPYREWVELDDMPAVLADLTAALRQMLDTASRPWWRR